MKAFSTLSLLLLWGCLSADSEVIDETTQRPGTPPGKADSFHHFSRYEIRGMLALQQHTRQAHWCDGKDSFCQASLESLASSGPFVSISGMRDAFTQNELNEIEKVACDIEGLCEPELSIVTWNLRNFPLSEMTLTDVAEQVQEQQPDIVGLQEIDDKYAFAELLSIIPGYDGFPAWSRYGTRVAILYKQSRVRVRDSENIFVDDQSAFPRPVLHVRFSLFGRAADKDLSVVVVHLKAQIDARSQARRQDAIEKLDHWMDTADHAESTFLIGDFNDSITDEAPNDVFHAFRDDSQYELLTQPLEEDGAYSYIVYQAMLDHIVATKHAADTMPVLDVDALAMDQEDPLYLRNVSDHRPVVSRHIPIIPAALR